MRSEATRRLAQNGLAIALVAAATIIIQIPMPATQGFVNVGDTAIFLVGLLLGPLPALLAGGLGSALADLLTGYAHWAPWTLVIKGLEGWIAAAVGYYGFQRQGRVFPGPVSGMLLAAIWMVVGYYVAGGILKGFPAALQSVPGNMVQGGVSVVAATILVGAVKGLRPFVLGSNARR